MKKTKSNIVCRIEKVHSSGLLIHYQLIRGFDSRARVGDSRGGRLLVDRVLPCSS